MLAELCEDENIYIYISFNSIAIVIQSGTLCKVSDFFSVVDRSIIISFFKYLLIVHLNGRYHTAEIS